MKTKTEVYFELEGVKRADQFALHSNNEVKSKAQGLCDELSKAAQGNLSDIEWQDGFPATPEHQMMYEQIVQSQVVPSAIRLIVEAVTPVFDRITAEVTASTKRFILGSTTLAAEVMTDKGSTYQMASRGTNLCLKCDPPPNCHICQLSVLTSKAGSPASKLVWYVTDGSNVFTYNLHCSIRLQGVAK